MAFPYVGRQLLKSGVPTNLNGYILETSFTVSTFHIVNI